MALIAKKPLASAAPPSSTGRIKRIGPRERKGRMETKMIKQLKGGTRSAMVIA
jgi:hypothetical protein